MLVYACFSWSLTFATVAVVAIHLEFFELADVLVELAAHGLLLGLLIYVIGAATEMVGNRVPAEKSPDTADSQVKFGSRNASLAAGDEEKHGNTR